MWYILHKKSYSVIYSTQQKLQCDTIYIVSAADLDNLHNKGNKQDDPQTKDKLQTILRQQQQQKQQQHISNSSTYRVISLLLLLQTNVQTTLNDGVDESEENHEEEQQGNATDDDKHHSLLYMVLLSLTHVVLHATRYGTKYGSINTASHNLRLSKWKRLRRGLETMTPASVSCRPDSFHGQNREYFFKVSEL